MDMRTIMNIMENAEGVSSAAEEFAKHLVELGMRLEGDIVHSTNRYFEKSSYIQLDNGWRIRVSDHGANELYRINEIHVHFKHTSRKDAEAVIERMRTADLEAKNRAGSAIAKRDAYEAKAKAAWLATDKQDERGIILRKLYPNMSRMNRQDVAARWSKG